MSRRRRPGPPNEIDPKRPIRCAIYTRKSSEEGLDQDFNSLDAQRESAEAFVASQKALGWMSLPDRYDDGGFSGGSMERPALDRLLRDIEAGKVDCVVVYKVDRLSRSLMDFARIMEAFDLKGVSFVSVTQQFNTTSSMGRLTLNILLSFAQFEREIIGERIRDKIAAQKRKGKWAGGVPVLGYDVDRSGPSPRLVVNATEAARVRQIFDLYLEKGSLLPVVTELRSREWTNKRRTTKKGKVIGGRPYDKATLHQALTNPVYVGKIAHHGALYDGQHDAIIDAAQFDRVQALLRTNGRGGGAEVRNKYGALLRGLLRCKCCGHSMTHTFAGGRKGRTYRYYRCVKAIKQGAGNCPSGTLPAAEIERVVVDEIRTVVTDPALQASVLAQAQAQNEAASVLSHELMEFLSPARVFFDMTSSTKKTTALGRPKKPLTLDAEEREKLETIARRPKTSQRLALRARIVLACAAGKDNTEVAEDLNVRGATVGKWRERFRVNRLDGLLDEPRPGAPRTVTDKDVEAVITRTLESKPKGATHWSTRSMAEASGLSQSAISRIWRAFGLKPHRTETFKLSTDPLFVEKVRDIVGLYMDPPERAVVLCVDEKSQVQALDRTQPLLPMGPGHPERRSHDYVRHGTTSLFAALNVKTGAVIGRCQARHRQQEFVRFLDDVDDLIRATCEPDIAVHLVMDNYATHKAPQVRRWLQKHPRYQVHFTPTSASWLNLVERIFSELTTKQIRRGAHRSVHSLKAAITEYLEAHNQNPKPFRWTATADTIFRKLEKLCSRISDSGH